MKLYSVHCGFYDTECGGIYESHTNLFVAAESFEEARLQVKSLPLFKSKRMHVDGLEEIEVVDGFRILLVSDALYPQQTRIHGHRHRDLALQPQPKGTQP